VQLIGNNRDWSIIYSYSKVLRDPKYRSFNESHKIRRFQLQSLWVLKPFLQQRLDSLVRSIPLDGISEGGYTASLTQIKLRFMTVHYRRGDKLQVEAKAISNEVYLAETVKILTDNIEVRTVILISDDFAYLQTVLPEYLTLQTQFPDLNVALFENLYAPLVNRPVGENNGGFLNKGWDQAAFWKAPLSIRYEVTEELIVMLSLMSEGAFAICTYSSNLCRLVQCLRSAPENTVVSVDAPNWVP
jgi:hypothetical protein